MLHAAIHENDFLVARTIADYLLAADDVDLIVSIRIMDFFFGLLTFRDYLSEH